MSSVLQTADEVVVTLTFSRAEMAERGKRGAAATHSRHDSEQLTRAGREAFLARFTTNEERSAYFGRLARLSAEARRKRAAGKGAA